MLSTKTWLYGTVLALPVVGVVFYVLNPPQCPEHYTQAQVDNSHCIVGANIGGMPLFLLAAPLIWLATVVLVGWVMKRYRRRP